MNELIFYSALMILVLGHLVMASFFYRQISKTDKLSIHEKNEWRLKALIFPIGYYYLFKRRLNGIKK